MSNHMILESRATGDEISPIIDKIELALDGVKRGHAIIASLSIALILMNPEISAEQLADGVRDVSRYICLLLEGSDLAKDGDGETGKQLMN